MTSRKQERAASETNNNGLTQFVEEIYALPPKFLQKLPHFFHGAFAPSSIRLLLGMPYMPVDASVWRDLLHL